MIDETQGVKQISNRSIEYIVFKIKFQFRKYILNKAKNFLLRHFSKKKFIFIHDGDVYIPKGSYIYISILPPDNKCKAYDPTEILERFLEMHANKEITVNGVANFVDPKCGMLSITANCSLVRNQI